MKIDVFGFNSAKFDLPVLVPYLFPALQAEFGKFSVIKKGARFFLIETSCCNFKDILNFTTPIKLADYLKQNGVKEETFYRRGLAGAATVTTGRSAKACRHFSKRPGSKI